MSSVTIVVPNN